MNRDIASTAALVSDAGRASILVSLLGGTALPAGQLAIIANVSPQTASSHLAQLVAGGLLTVEQQGRYRYYRLANGEVANAIEALLALSPIKTQPSPILGRTSRPVVGSLGYARSCYSHLAGLLGVEIAEALQRRGMLVPADAKLYAVTQAGRAWLEQVGVVVREAEMKRPRFARRCLDWTERRHHLGGPLGAAVFTRLREMKWVAPVRDSRAVRLTLEGQRRLHELLGVRMPGN
jgi:DNA-binding transcriptional ArsR family regulator